jgi:predicted nucleic acid-binding protein
VTESPDSFVLDTSAILALWNEEEGASFVEKILRDKPQNKIIFISFMTVMECRYRVWKDHGQSVADELIRSLGLLPITRVDVDDVLIMTASDLKARYKISVADSWIVATAIVHNATLVHKDPEFDALSDRVAMKTLPYKKTK